MKIVLMIFICASASAATYYVDATGGNDAANGTSSGTAWKSLSKINGTTFSPGDTILFKRGETWTGQLLPVGSGTPGSPITWSDYSTGALPIIDGFGQIYTIQVTTSNNIFDSIHVTRGSSAGFHLDGSLNNTVQNSYGDFCYSCLLSSGTASLTVSNCTFTGATNEGIGFHGSPIATVTQCTLTNNNQGINCSLSGVGFLMLSDTYFLNNNDGLYSCTGLLINATRCTFIVGAADNHCIILNNGDALSYSLIDLSAAADTSKIFIYLEEDGSIAVNNCTVYGGSINSGQITTDSPGKTINFTNCIFQNIWRLALVSSGAVNMDHCITNSITTGTITSNTSKIAADPLFVNSATGNFHLQAGSPAIRAGLNIGLTTDLDGHGVANPPSIGAYEFIVGPTISFSGNAAFSGRISQ